mmetsp:Transcript_236/g.796  ORF Transcript_236/g.796 Transcript_236/m.796 type:complete len:181 (-) Transcript_236:31-573(-)
MHRVASSTLMTEMVSLSEALAEAQWVQCWWKLAVDPSYELQRFNNRDICTQVIRTREREHDLTVFMDSKSVYDIVNQVKPSFGGIDRRAALEARVVVDAIKTSGASVRWIPHERNLVDSFTKIRGNVWGLVKTLESGSYDFESEEAVLKARKQYREDTGKTNPRPMRSMALRDPLQGQEN